MIKNIYTVICLLVLVVFMLLNIIVLKVSEYDNFYGLAILHDGRVKPLGVFAEEIFNKVKRHHNSLELMADLIFDPSVFCKKNIYHIRNSEVNINLGLPLKSDFNLVELLDSFRKNIDLVTSLKKLNINVLSNSQKELLDLYSFVFYLVDIGTSFDLFLFNDDISKNFSKNITSKYSLANELGETSKDYILVDDALYCIKLIPLNDTEWLGLNSFFKKMGYKSNKELDVLRDAHYYYSIKDIKKWNQECGKFNNITKINLSKKSKLLINVEIFYNNLMLMHKSCISFFFMFFVYCFFKKKLLFFNI